MFSSNSEGACPACNGNGVIYFDLSVMAGVAVTCEECEGKRFHAAVLKYKLGGRDISEVLATHMGEMGGIYVLDEPTSGLRLADVDRLLALLDRLVDDGRSVIVIEHNQAVMAHADWIIDLGPGAGHDGGRIIFEGTPADIAKKPSTLTGKHLAAYVSG